MKRFFTLNLITKNGWFEKMLLFILFLFSNQILNGFGQTYPAEEWETRKPEELGVDGKKLNELAASIGGDGCVVKNGFMIYTWGNVAKSADVASAFKPVLTSLLFIALQEKLIDSIDEPISKYQPRLKEINNGKDARITWRHLAMQISGYGLKEPPGVAYSYNDYALALYYDTLMNKVFQKDSDLVLKQYLAQPLQFQDGYSFNAFGKKDRPGRLAISVRDFARFGLLILRNGNWNGKQLIRSEYIQLMLNSPLPPDFPKTSGEFSDMLPGQRSIGGGRNITAVGPGYYSFNLWLNRTNSLGQRLLASAPDDTVLASGHGGKRLLAIIPSLDLIVCWNDTRIEDQDSSPENPDTLMNRAIGLLVAAASGKTNKTETSARTELGISGTKFTINGRPTFLLGISYYGALGANEKTILNDLDVMQKYGFNWIRVWATWGGFGLDVSAVDPVEGSPREPYLTRLKWLVGQCDKRGMVVDITLSRGNDIAGKPRIANYESHMNAVKTVIAALKDFKNWYIDLSNERNIRDSRYTSFEDLIKLRQVARQLNPQLLVTASHAGDLSIEELKRYLNEVKVDFITPHRPRDPNSVKETGNKTSQYLQWMKEIGTVKPVHYQEPFRRDFGRWQPKAEDFWTDLSLASASGAAGWCFHNGDNRAAQDSKPRRSFDLRIGSLFTQLDEEELKFLRLLAEKKGELEF
jgi:CubicO group peptidase (beta-lactamase class C family)